jgi:hypothetical protein
VSWLSLPRSGRRRRDQGGQARLVARMWAALVGAPCDIDLQFTNEEEIQRVPMKVEGSTDPQVSPFPHGRRHHHRCHLCHRRRRPITTTHHFILLAPSRVRSTSPMLLTQSDRG